jgi:hypothetical protein
MPSLIPPLGHSSNSHITGFIRPVAHAAGSTQYDVVTVISTKTQITLGEVEFSHPTGYWGPFDTDNGII